MIEMHNCYTYSFVTVEMYIVFYLHLYSKYIITRKFSIYLIQFVSTYYFIKNS